MLDTSRSVASIVLDHSETAPVFQRNRIDYCCKGNLSLREACADRSIKLEAVLGELESAIAERRGEKSTDPRTMSTAGLIAHIIDRHHGYLRRVFPFVAQLAKKVAGVHGDHQPNLRELRTLVDELIASLEPHLDDEESTLFPALMVREPDRAFISRELAAMNTEHLEVGAILEKIRALTDDFKPAEWACGSYRALYGELEALEADVLKHVHIENHVLSPRFSS